MSSGTLCLGPRPNSRLVVLDSDFRLFFLFSRINPPRFLFVYNHPSIEWKISVKINVTLYTRDSANTVIYRSTRVYRNATTADVQNISLLDIIQEKQTNCWNFTSRKHRLVYDGILMMFTCVLFYELLFREKNDFSHLNVKIKFL